MNKRGGSLLKDLIDKTAIIKDDESEDWESAIRKASIPLIKNKKIAIVGDGKLVGRPLTSMWLKSGYNITTFNEENSSEMQKTLRNYDVVVSAVGKPALIKSEMLKKNCVVVDAGTSTDDGKVVGDLAEEVREDRKDLTVTPKIGGVGPLTIASLIDNVIISARKQADKQGQVDL